MKNAFDSKKYLKLQTERIFSLIKDSKEKLYIEFGGKLLDDKHAARVIPGFEEAMKMKIIKKVFDHGADMILIISAKDVLRNRIRGDHKITYDKEALRVLKGFNEYGIKIKKVVISMIPIGEIDPKIVKLKKILEKEEVDVYLFNESKKYKNSFTFRELEVNPFIKTKNNIVCIVSPGGGSGKFGICLSQLYKEMKNGVIPDYLKYETFPIQKLSIDHPLNLAFMAASADFYDVVMKDKRHGSSTSYNRDIENYEKLRSIAKLFPKEGKMLTKINSATHMGINAVAECITDNETVEKEASAEIARRLIRYKFEVKNKEENIKTYQHCLKVLKILCKTSSSFLKE